MAKWAINKGLSLIMLLFFVFIGARMIFYSFQVSPTELTDDGYPLNTFLLYSGIVWIVLPILMVLGTNIYINYQDRREKNFRENGLKGHAKILSVEQTGTFINNNPQLEFLLEITLEDGEIYQLKHKEVVSMISSIQAGTIVPVYVDPKNRKNILLDY